jgi:glycosyltransferase involved in cell wall biosynthesis
LETELYTRASLIFATNENARRSFMQHYRIPAERVCVVGAGVDQVHEHPEKTYNEHTILFVRIDFERKGGPTLLKAFAEVRKRLPQARLLIAGPRPGAPQDGVNWLGHVADRDGVNQLFSESTVFAMAPVCEPFGLVLIEAMSHGLPVVCSTADAMAEIVQEGKTGYLVPPGDAAALTERLITLLESPSLCSELGRAGRMRVEQQFLWAQVVDRIETGLRTACANR